MIGSATAATPPPPPAWRGGRVRSFDGTELDYRVYGEQGPWLVLVNGLGSTYSSWTPLCAALAGRWRILVWDLRGLYDSEIPQDLKRLSVRDHARDLQTLLATEGVEQAVVAGWSMGVQVALELYRHVPECVRGLVLIAGTPGRFFSSCFRLPAGRLTVPLGLRVGRQGAGLISALVRGAVTRPDFALWMKRLGLVAEASPRVASEARQFARLDWAVYLRMAAEMELHDARRVPALVRVPTLVLGGSRDIMAPPRVLRSMARAIADSELRVVPGGTHYTILEAPELLGREVQTFLERRFPLP